MTIRLETRELARRLLVCESNACKSSEPEVSPTIRVYEKLRQSLSAFAGIAGFRVSRFSCPGARQVGRSMLGEFRVTEDGRLQGLGEVELQSDFDRGTGGDPVGEAGIILIALLLGLLHIFIGEALTASLLQVTWPGVALDECDSEKGRNA